MAAAWDLQGEVTSLEVDERVGTQFVLGPFELQPVVAQDKVLEQVVVERAELLVDYLQVSFSFCLVWHRGLICWPTFSSF